MSEELYGEIGALRTAIRRAINEIDSAEFGEGIAHNLFFIRRDLEKVLIATLKDRAPIRVGRVNAE